MCNIYQIKENLSSATMWQEGEQNEILKSREKLITALYRPSSTPTHIKREKCLIYGLKNILSRHIRDYRRVDKFSPGTVSTSVRMQQKARAAVASCFPDRWRTDDSGATELNKWSFGRCHETHLLEMRRIYVCHFSPAPCGRNNTLSEPYKNSPSKLITVKTSMESYRNMYYGEIQIRAS